MTKREEIIEAVGGAIERAWNSDDNCVEGLPPIDLSESERRLLAIAAFDAALLAMMEPSREALTAAGASPDGVSARGGVDHLGKMLPRYWRAMLSTLSA